MWGWLAACTADGPQGPGAPAPTDGGYVSAEYVDGERWLCRPDLDDVCDGDLDVTAVAADGSQSPQPFEPAEDPSVDCFYVYPTTSLDPTPLADWSPGPEEPFVATFQAARYQAACRLYAPLYRQVTVAGLLASVDDPTLFDAPYADVLDAFRHFLDQDSRGRPFVLIGHSQGSVHLARLIAEEVEGTPLADRLVAAHLLGGFVEVPPGEVVGGTFAETPLCTAPDQTGCVVHYNTFRADDPPGDDAFFGVAASAGREIACTHPAALGGGEAPLSLVLPTSAPPEVAALLGLQPGPYADPDHAPVPTPFYAMPGLLSGACERTSEGRVYLAVTAEGDPEDPRADDIGGELFPGWGLHLVDVPAAMGDLVALAQAQIAAY